MFGLTREQFIACVLILTVSMVFMIVGLALAQVGGIPFCSFWCWVLSFIGLCSC